MNLHALTRGRVATGWLVAACLLAALGCEPPAGAPVGQGGPPGPPAPPSPPDASAAASGAPAAASLPSTASPATGAADLTANPATADTATTGAPAVGLPPAGSQFEGPLKIIETPEIARLRAVGLKLPIRWQRGTHELKNDGFPQMTFPQGNKLTDAELPLLLKFPNLRELICEYSPISDAGMETIGQLKQLTRLALTGGVQGVTDKGMVHLRGLTHLERLSILGSAMTDQGVAPLAELTNLKALDLTSSNLTDDSLQYFRSLKNLQVLYLENTGVTPGGIAELQQALPNCRIEN